MKYYLDSFLDEGDDGSLQTMTIGYTCEANPHELSGFQIQAVGEQEDTIEKINETEEIVNTKGNSHRYELYQGTKIKQKIEKYFINFLFMRKT